MFRPFTQEFKTGFLNSFYEYLIITIPVGIYVSLEALHKNDWNYLYKSPEWSIATIFLAFISLIRYRNAAEKSGKKILEPIFGIISIFSLLQIVFSAINASMSFDNETSRPTIFRIILFTISSSQFFLLMTGSNLLRKHSL